MKSEMSSDGMEEPAEDAPCALHDFPPEPLDSSPSESPLQSVRRQSSDGECGWGSCHPTILQPLAKVWTFIVLYMVFSFTHGVQGAYTISVLTTLQRRFNFPSYVSGSLVTVSTIGYIVCVIFVSFFFSKSHPPRLFAGCMLLTSLCALLYVIPHFIYGTGNDDIDAAHAQKAVYVFSANTSDGASGVQIHLCREREEGPYPAKGNCSESEKKTADDEISFVKPALAMFALSEILQGAAGAPMWTVGVAYLDDHTNPELSAKLIGIMYAVRFLSPMVSFAMGGYFLSIYASLKETDLTPEHPQWVGAWWLGYFVCSIINICICIPTSMIPKQLKPIKKSSSETKDKAENQKNRKNKEEENGVSENLLLSPEEDKTTPGKTKKSITDAISNWKALPRATLRLISNPIYVLACITITIDCFILGFMTFLPKYIEIHFQQTAWAASLIGGMAPWLFASCGSFTGGIISGKIKGLDGGVAGNCRMTFVMSSFSLLFLIPAMLLSCPDFSYSGNFIDKRLNITTDCSVSCGCSSVFDPVCGSDGFSYFSPCHAGCSGIINETGAASGQKNIRSTGCRCVAEVEGDNGGGESGVVFAGICEGSCRALIPYIISAIAVFVSINLYSVPFTNIILRCTHEDDKSFALGLQLFLVCICIFPAPMMYGVIFESACVLREASACSDIEGSCLLYDRNALRLSFHGLTLGLRSISATLYLITYLIARRKSKALEEESREKGKTKFLEINANEIKETVL